MSAKAVRIESESERDELQALDAALKRRVESALADKRPSIPQVKVFADLKARYEKRRA